MAESVSLLDFNTISFPSDVLTLKKLRDVEPQLFATDDILDLNHIFNNSGCFSMLYWERRVAQQSYNATLGVADPDKEDREELVDMLTEHYKEYGLSSGEHQTSEMLRGIESQAASQAAKHLGKAR